MPLGKMANITHETMKFLKMVCEDIGALEVADKWIALNFENDSVDFDCEISSLESVTAKRGQSAFRSIMANEAPDAGVFIRPATRLQYSQIAAPIDIDEIIRFGLYTNGSQRPEAWYELDRSRADAITEEIPQVVSYHGEIQGIVHALFKETDHPKLVVRELSTKNLVDCFFKIEMYHSAIEVLEERDAVIFVEGQVTENMALGMVESIDVTDFRLAPEFNVEKFNAFIGSVPDLTGKKSTEETIEEYRANAN
jgi:hypothetical protein